MEDIIKYRQEKINALSSYYFAVEEERKGNAVDCMNLYSLALEKYLDLDKKCELTVVELEVVIEILKKLNLNDSVISFTLKRNNAEESANHQRLNGIKGRFNNK